MHPDSLPMPTSFYGVPVKLRKIIDGADGIPLSAGKLSLDGISVPAQFVQ